MASEPLTVDELVEHWALLSEDRPLVANKRGATRLGFVLLLKFYTQHGRFPRGRAELPDEAVEFVAGQVRVPASELGFYEWAGRAIKAHRVQFRTHLGFRECSVSDAEKLTGWLAEHVALRERRPDQVHAELLPRCRAESIEPPTTGRCARIVQGALRAGEETLTLRVHARLTDGAVERILELVAEDGDDAEDSSAPSSRGDDRPVLSAVKSAPGNVSLETMLAEIDKLLAVRAIGLPVELFADVAPKVVSGWRARAAVESPSHLRTHPLALRVTLLAAFATGAGS